MNYYYMWPDLGKPTIYTHQLKFILLRHWITTLKEYSCTASPLATVNWSALLNSILPTLWCHDGGNGTMGWHLLGGQYLKLLILLAGRLLGLVIWQRHLLVACTGSRTTKSHFATSLPTSPPTPTHPSPPIHPPPPFKGLKLLPTLKKSSQKAQNPGYSSP